MPAGRPTDRTPENAATIVQALRGGATYEAAAGKADLCRDTLAAWRADDPEFSDTCKRARAAGIAHLLEQALKTRNPVTAKVRMWLLACMSPDECSPKQKVEHSGTLGIQGLLAAVRQGAATPDAG